MLLKLLWEDYTPEQEAEQARWKSSVFKSPFSKKRRIPVAKKKVERTGPNVPAATDPFDTKPPQEPTAL